MSDKLSSLTARLKTVAEYRDSESLLIAGEAVKLAGELEKKLREACDLIDEEAYPVFIPSCAELLK